MDNDFVPIISADQLPEDMIKPAVLMGRNILLIKKAGQVFGIASRCPHMGCKFSGGSLDGNVVICPCHDWRFNLETGEYEENPAYVLTTYPYELRDGKIWVRLAEDF